MGVGGDQTRPKANSGPGDGAGVLLFRDPVLPHFLEDLILKVLMTCASSWMSHCLRGTCTKAEKQNCRKVACSSWSARVQAQGPAHLAARPWLKPSQASESGPFKPPNPVARTLLFLLIS